jgi:radical SAM protein (TIGR01212 family)
MTCPNRDGKIGFGGCSFCSAGGSGDFSAPAMLSIPEQIELDKRNLQKKVPAKKFIAYFQAFTNTYGNVEHLRNIYMEAASHKDIAIISIGTRPDCLPPEVIELLKEINSIKPVWVELGMQTSNEETARFINRGYPLETYDKAMADLHAANIKTITHVILGFPQETSKDMLDSVQHAIDMGTWGIKLQLLHILKGTPLGELYDRKPFHVLSLEEYTQILVRCVQIIPENVIIHRLTGDGPKSILIAPKWSGDKKRVLNTINKALRD